MERSDNSWWLAATAIGDLAALSQTVASILGGGLSLTQICLFAREDAMPPLPASMSTPEGQLEGADDFAGALFDWPLTSENHRIVATSPILPRAFLHAAGITGAPPGRWPAGTNSSRDLIRHVEAGQIGLIVRCIDGQQLSEVTRHLLAHSTTKVTTHAFSYAAD